MRDLLRSGSSALLLVAMMFLGSLVLWIGIPLGWLYVGSQVQGATESLGAALAVTALGVVVSIFIVISALDWLNRSHVELQERRGRESYGQTALEGILALSAGLTVVGFTVWFLFFSGSSPIPLTNAQ